LLPFRKAALKEKVVMIRVSGLFEVDNGLGDVFS
jgi:hypothetical protein